MLHILFCFHVHQPFRLKKLKVTDVGMIDNYFDDELNRAIFERASRKCYLPMNSLLMELIKKFEGRFRVSFSITGTFVEQAKRYNEKVLISFKDLAKTGCVEFIGETYYHSLAFIFDFEEFLEQIILHREMIENEFGQKPIAFRNTELIYSDEIAKVVPYKLIFTEGTEKILKGKSPLYAYLSREGQILLLRHYTLSDDISFRFSDRGWVEYPLNVDKFVNWVSNLPLIEKKGRNLYLVLYMDYETFGEHQWGETGIFEFMRVLPERILEHDISFSTPSDVFESMNYTPEVISVPYYVSWADTERDLSAWLSNSLQWQALKSLSDLIRKIKERGDKELLKVARLLSSSDHFYYMCKKYFQDGDVHKYFSPYNSPEDAFIYFMNALADLESRLK